MNLQRINPDYLHTAPDPIRRQINTAAVTAQLYYLFRHFFAVDLEPDLVLFSLRSNILFVFICQFFVIEHFDVFLSTKGLGTQKNNDVIQ